MLALASTVELELAQLASPLALVVCTSACCVCAGVPAGLLGLLLVERILSSCWPAGWQPCCEVHPKYHIGGLYLLLYDRLIDRERDRTNIIYPLKTFNIYYTVLKRGT